MDLKAIAAQMIALLLPLTPEQRAEVMTEFAENDEFCIFCGEPGCSGECLAEEDDE